MDNLKGRTNMPTVWWLEPMRDAWAEGKRILEDNGCRVILGRLQTEGDTPYSGEEIVEKGRDADARCRALAEGWIAGAALDVFQKEPLPASSPLLRPEVSHKLVLSPHVSGLSEEMERDLTLAQVDCCLKALKGEPPKSTLNPEALSMWRERVERLS